MTLWPDADTPRARAPDDTRIYAVGDVHGRADLLDRLHDEISRDAASAPESRKMIVYLGDYVDRGPDSAAVLSTLTERPLDGIEQVCLKGNHEDFLLRFLDDPGICDLWLMNGGRATLRSYGLSVGRVGGDEAAAALSAELRARLPDAHLRFLEGLPLSHQAGGYLFVHAGIRPGVELSRQTAEDLLWIREPFLGSPYDHGCVVVHGHTPVEAPDVRFNRINIDTGAVWSDCLTALVMHADQWSFLRS
jgi:serine/threonine protein phosphatase 1